MTDPFGRTLEDNRMARLLGGDGELRPDATGDAPCGEAEMLWAPDAGEAEHGCENTVRRAPHYELRAGGVPPL